MIEPEAPLEQRQGPLEQRQGSFLGHVNVVMLTYITDGALAFATGILVARALGPDGRGAYALFIVSAAFIQLLLGLGAGNAAIYYLNRRELTVRDVLAASHVVTLVAGAATLAIVAIIAGVDEDGFLGTGVSPWLFAAAGPALMYWNLMRLTLQAQSRFVDLGIVTVAQQSIFLVAIASLMGGGDPTASQIAACLSGATAVAGLLGLQRVGIHHLDLGLVVRPAFGTLRKLAGFGLQGEAGNILQLLNYRLDQYIVRAYVGLAGVGIYAVGASMTEAIFIMANAVALVLLPRLSASEEDAQWMAPIATRNTIMVAVLGALVLAAAAPVIVPLAFGEAYDDSIEPLWLLLPGTVALCGSKVLTSYIFSQGRPLVNTGITLVSLVVTLIADLALIPWLDVNGAAIASSLAYGAHFAAALYAYGRISGRSPLTALIPGRDDVALYRDALRGLGAKLARAAEPRAASGMNVEPVPDGQRLRIAVLGDFDGVHTRSWVRWFVERGHEIHAVSFHPPANPLEGLTVHTLRDRAQRSSPSGTETRGDGRQSRLRGPMRLLHGLRYRRAGLKRVLEEIDPDIFHAHFVVEHGFYGALAGLHPYVVTAWGSDILVEPSRDPISRQIAKWALKRADLITSNNGVMADAIVGLGVPRSKVEVITLGADAWFGERWRDSVNVAGRSDGPPTILSTRAHEPLYNLDVLIAAFARAAPGMAGARLVVAHSGSLTKRLMAQAAALTAQSVEFTGTVDAGRLRDLMIGAEVFVSVPSSDGTSVALLQAMSAGAFPIVADLDTQREWITDGDNGLAVRPQDAAGLAGAMTRALGDAGLRRKAAERNRSIVAERGTNETQMAKMEQLYLRLAGRA